jgi:hypothetical protein
MASDISRGWNSRVTIRRFAAILAGEVVGYSRLMSADEATMPPSGIMFLHVGARRGDAAFRIY